MIFVTRVVSTCKTLKSPAGRWQRAFGWILHLLLASLLYLWLTHLCDEYAGVGVLVERA